MIRKFLWLLLLVSPLTFGFTLKWDQVIVPTCDLTGFYVYKSQIPGVYTDPPIATVPATNACGGLTDASFTGTDPNSGTYYFVVKSYDSSNNISAASNEVSKTFQDVTPPAAASNLRIQ